MCLYHKEEFSNLASWDPEDQLLNPTAKTNKHKIPQITLHHYATSQYFCYNFHLKVYHQDTEEEQVPPAEVLPELMK